MSSSLVSGPYASAVSIKLTPSSTARLRTFSAFCRSGGQPQMPSPVTRIAPKPRRLIVKSPPKLNVGFVAMFDDVAVSAPRITSDLPARSAAPLAKAALGDQAGYQLSRRHIEAVVRGGTFIWRNSDRDLLPITPGVGVFYFFRAPFFDRNFLQSVAHFPIDRGRRQRNVKRNVLGLRGQRLQICADLICHISRVSSAVGPDNYQIDFTTLHQMARRAVCDDRVRHTVLSQFPRSEFRTLISRSRFSHPHMQWQAAIVRGIDRRSRGAVINKCEPTCIAVSKHIDRLVALRFGDLPNQRQAVF